jgi:SM-20-related protein
MVHDYDWMADQLTTSRWLVIGDWLAADAQQLLLDEVRQRAQRGSLSRSRVGRGSEMQVAVAIRGDSIEWLHENEASPAVVELLQRLDAIRTAMNERLYLGLVDTEAHFAHYPPGSGYQRHLDRFRSLDTRTLSLVVHLGDPWLGEHGGELRLFIEGADGELSIDLPPKPGQLTVFVSAEIEHEVLPTRRDRYSIAGWMRRRGA